MSAITFLASLLAAPVPLWLAVLTMLAAAAALHHTHARRLNSHARILGHMDRWADTVEARLEDVAPERPRGLYAAPGRSPHFLMPANDQSLPDDDVRNLSDREMKEVLTRLTRRDRVA